MGLLLIASGIGIIVFVAKTPMVAGPGGSATVTPMSGPTITTGGQ